MQNFSLSPSPLDDSQKWKDLKRNRTFDEILKKYGVLWQDVLDYEILYKVLDLLKKKFLAWEITLDELDTLFTLETSEFLDLFEEAEKWEFTNILQYFPKNVSSIIVEWGEANKSTKKEQITDIITLEEANRFWWSFLVDSEYYSLNTRKVKKFFRRNFSVWEYRSYEKKRKWYITDELNSYWTEVSEEEVLKAKNNEWYKIKYNNKEGKSREVLLKYVDLRRNYLDGIAILCNADFLEKRLDIIKNHSDIFLEDGQHDCILIFFYVYINNLGIKNEELLEWGNKLWWEKFLELYLDIRSLISGLEVSKKERKMEDFITYIKEKWIEKAQKFIEREEKKVVNWIRIKLKIKKIINFIL
jgi:hypothetical protein